MKKLGKSLIMLICVSGILLFFGCTAFQDIVTPCHIDQKVIDYSSQKPTSYLPWTTLFDAKRLLSYVDYNYIVKQNFYKTKMKENTVDYNFCTDTQINYNENAEQFKQKVFNPSGPVGAMIPLLFGGTIGAMFINTPKKEKKND